MNKEEKLQDIPAEIRPFLTRRRVLQAGAIGGAAAVAAACGVVDQLQMVQHQLLKMLINQKQIKKLFGQTGRYICQLMKRLKNVQN